jgi:hypothetical protein
MLGAPLPRFFHVFIPVAPAFKAARPAISDTCSSFIPVPTGRMPIRPRIPARCAGACSNEASQSKLQ